MPIFMDRHDVPASITAEDIAQLHLQDLKVQHQFGCKALTYWFDEKRRTAFCLVDAPAYSNIQEMHHHAHGQVPNEVIEVDVGLVESFLGRIQNPVDDSGIDLHIIKDPAFRTLMVVRVENTRLTFAENNAFKYQKERIATAVENLARHYNASIVRHNTDNYLLSFKSVLDAVVCAVEIYRSAQSKNQTKRANLAINIGINAGLPVTGHKALFEDTTQLAERLCEFAENGIVISTAVAELYINENTDTSSLPDDVSVLSLVDERFINQLMDFINNQYDNQELRVADFCNPLGMSKSQLYRKMISLSGKSPATFLKSYRLKRAAALILTRQLNVSEVASDTGFSSLSYFSKCFYTHYGVLPSSLLHALSKVHP